MVQVNQGHVISKGAFLHAYESTSSDRAWCFRMSQQVTARLPLGNPSIGGNFVS